MLTPVDIENKEFTKTFRGYDIYEVEEFMKGLVADYEKLYRGNADLKEKNAMLNDTIGTYKGMEETMQNAILVAQRTAEDIKKNAYERAETIVKDAEHRAAEAISKANTAISQLEKTYLSMQSEMNSFKAKMNALLSTYMQLLSELPEKTAASRAFETLQNSAPMEPIKAAPAPIMEEEPVSGDTNTFNLASLKKEVKMVTKIEEAEPAIEIERKPNPIVEELLQKNKVEQSQEEPISVGKQTIEKETPNEISSINLNDLKTFDVFSDDTI